jgi:hypothetical protein
MRKLIFTALAALALIMAGSSPGQAFRGDHVGVVVGVGPGWWGPGWGPYYPYPYYPYYAAPPVVVQQQPDTYIQQAPQAEEPSYWYFCKDPKGYYPYVKKCPTGWQKVVPSPTPDEDKE